MSWWAGFGSARLVVVLAWRRAPPPPFDRLLSSFARAYSSILSKSSATVWMGLRASLSDKGPFWSPPVAALMIVVSFTPFSWHFTSAIFLKKLQRDSPGACLIANRCPTSFGSM